MSANPSHSLLITRLHGQNVAVLASGDHVVELHSEGIPRLYVENQIYKGVVSRVLPGHQCAFVDLGETRQGYLHASDVLVMKERGGADRLEEAAISDLLATGDTLAVQVKRTSSGSKGPRLTMRMGLPGVRCILLPMEERVASSHRMTDVEERQRLEKTFREICPKGMGAIVRKAAEGCGKDDLANEVEELRSRWDKIAKDIASAPAPSLLYTEPDPILRTLRDVAGLPGLRILIDDDELLQRTRQFCESRCPSVLDQIEECPKDTLVTGWRLEKVLDDALRPWVWLRSGAAIVINRTEALTAIDVNTSKFKGKSDHTQTALAVNLEAVSEIARQLRLRNVSGIVVVDFVDMPKPEQSRQVESALKEALKEDRARCRPLPMTNLGLIEMTRKRLGESLDKVWQHRCSTCNGLGVALAHRPLASRTLASVRQECAHPGSQVVHVQAHPGVIAALLDHEGTALRALEGTSGVSIQLHEDSALQLEDVKVYAR